MAKVHYDVGLKMTTLQTLLGWLYLPCFAVLTSLGIQLLAGLLNRQLDGLTLNILYMSVNLVFVLLVYHRFLARSFRGFTEHFWPFIQTLILGFAMYYVFSIVLALPLTLLGDTTENNKAVVSLLSENNAVMLVFTVLAAPIVEEILFRGVVFGSLHRKNRILAYAASVVCFALVHVWQFAATLSVPELAANCLVYIGPSIALGWTYEKSGTILCPILLHAIINALACGINLAL